MPQADASSDAAIAAELQMEEIRGAQTGAGTAPSAASRGRRGPLRMLRRRQVLLVDKDTLFSKRVSLIVLAVLDMIGVLTMLLQLTGSGFPQSMDEFNARWDDDNLVDEFWFAPLFTSLIFPILGIVGSLLLWRWPLWLYCTFAFLSIALRTHFLYEAGKLEGLEEQTPLLLDMILLTSCIFLQVYVFQSASMLALLIGRLRMQNTINEAGESRPLRRGSTRTEER